MSERKLLLDQPDRVTVKGTTEQVVVPQKSSPDQRQDESSKNEQSQPVLLVEQPDGCISLLG